MDNQIKVALYKDFESVKSIWEDVLEASSTDNLFVSFDWVHAWWSATDGMVEREPWILCVYHNGRAVALVPLMLSKRYRFRVLQFMGTSFGGFGDFIITDSKDEVLKAIFNWLWERRRRWDAIVLQELCMPEDELEGFCTRARTSGFKSYRASFYDHVITHIQGSWEEFVARNSSKMRDVVRDIKRRRKLLSGIGKVEFFTYNKTNKDRYEEILNDVVDVEKRSWKYTNGTSMLCTRPQWDFYRDVLSRFMEKGSAEVWILRLDGKPVSFAINIVYRNRLYYMVPSYDQAYRRHGVGAILQQAIFEDCFRRGIEIFDFLPGNEPYQRPWASEVQKSYQVTLWHSSVRSYLAHMVFVHAKQKLRRSKAFKYIRKWIS